MGAGRAHPGPSRLERSDLEDLCSWRVTAALEGRQGYEADENDEWHHVHWRSHPRAEGGQCGIQVGRLEPPRSETLIVDPWFRVTDLNYSVAGCLRQVPEKIAVVVIPIDGRSLVARAGELLEPIE